MIKNVKWETLATLEEGESLSLIGFLFQTENGHWILSKEPDLKKCCLGKQESQIQLIGNFSRFSTNTALQVKGTFHCNLNSSYILTEAEVIPKEIIFPIWTFVAIVGCISLFKLKRLLP